MSPARPQASSNPPKVREYALSTHCRPVRENPRSLPISGKVTLTMEKSIVIKNSTLQRRAKAVVGA